MKTIETGLLPDVKVPRGARVPSSLPVPLRTPDGRYLVVRGRLWRATNPHLSASDRERFVTRLMDARRQLRGAASPEVRAAARAEVQAAKVALGERGPVWWSDGVPDFNRKMVANTPYAEWFERSGAPSA